MNINNIYSSTEEYQTPVNCEQASDASFEALLCAPTGKFTGSEYNWVHLEDMKTSKLDFKNEAIEKKEYYARKDAHQPVLRKELLAAESIENVCGLKPSQDKSQIFTSASIALSNNMKRKIERLFKHLSAEINGLPDIKNMRTDNASFGTETKAAGFTKLTYHCENSAQSYPMYRNKNEIELSMLVENMSNTQLLKLKDIIVQLLHKKGLRLRTFRINGVPL